MSANTETRGQMAGHHNRLVKWLDTVKISDIIAKFLVDFSNATVDFSYFGYNFCRHY